MTKTITRLFDSHTEALRALDDLEQAGVDHDRISLVSNNSDNWHKDHRHAVSDGGPLGKDADGDNDTAEGAGKGATTGGLIGGAGGLLAGLGMLAIPGLGPVVAAGWLVSTAVGAAIGAAAGGAAGGLLGALKDAGHTDEEANVYSEGVRRGGTLVSVRAEDGEASRIEAILDQQRGVAASVRGQDYRAEGWNRFDPDSQPYNQDQVAAERSRYNEARSFMPQDRTEAGVETDMDRDRPSTGGIAAPIPGAER